MAQSNYEIGNHGSIRRVLMILFSMMLCMSSLRTINGFQMSMTSNHQKVAVVTGATRGIGRGIALELGRSGYKVYCVGRSSRALKGNIVGGQRPVATILDLTVESIADEITASGGVGIGMACDLSLDGQIEEVIATIEKQENARLDVLVCSAYSTPTIDTPLSGDFWTQGMEMWDAVNGVGLRQVYAACLAATPLMIQTASLKGDATPPLICLVSSFGGKSYTFNVAYGVGKAAIDRLALDMSVQLKKHGVATTALYPGLVQTEANMQMLEDGTWDEASGEQDLDLVGFGESTAFSGKALVALLSLPREELLDKRSGTVQVVAELAKELDFYDDDSTKYRPPSIRNLQYLLPNFVFPSIEAQSGKPIPDWIKNNIPDVLLPWSIFSGPPPEMPPKE